MRIFYHIRQLFRRFRNWLLRKEEPIITLGNFDRWSFPIIRNMGDTSLIEDLISVQPMRVPSHKQYYTEFVDVSNPRIGYIGLEDKNPEQGGCSRQGWGKIWTPDGWVNEKNGVDAYKAACAKYHPLYKAEIAKEREAWNKEHGITPEDTACVFPMKVIYDSSKNFKKT